MTYVFKFWDGGRSGGATWRDGGGREWNDGPGRRPLNRTRSLSNKFEVSLKCRRDACCNFTSWTVVKESIEALWTPGQRNSKLEKLKSR